MIFIRRSFPYQLGLLLLSLATLGCGTDGATPTAIPGATTEREGNSDRHQVNRQPTILSDDSGHHDRSPANLHPGEPLLPVELSPYSQSQSPTTLPQTGSPSPAESTPPRPIPLSELPSETIR